MKAIGIAKGTIDSETGVETVTYLLENNHSITVNYEWPGITRITKELLEALLGLKKEEETKCK